MGLVDKGMPSWTWKRKAITDALKLLAEHKVTIRVSDCGYKYSHNGQVNYCTDRLSLAALVFPMPAEVIEGKKAELETTRHLLTEADLKVVRASDVAVAARQHSDSCRDEASRLHLKYNKDYNELAQLEKDL